MRVVHIAGLVLVTACGARGAPAEDGAAAAKAILGDPAAPASVTALRKTLAELDVALEAASKQGDKPAKATDKQLADIERKLEVDLAVVARARPLATEATAQILAFYAGVAELRSMLGAHVRAAMADDAVFAADARAAADATIKDGPLAGMSRYAVVIAPATEGGGSGGAQLVELGPQYCGAKPAPQGKPCPDGEAATGFGYRSEPQALWKKADVATDFSEPVPTGKVVMLAASGVGDSVFHTQAGVASELMYAARLRALRERLHGKAGAGGVLDDAGRLASTLQAAAAH